jgi:hypothetical protein
VVSCKVVVEEPRKVTSPSRFRPLKRRQEPEPGQNLTIPLSEVSSRTSTMLPILQQKGKGWSYEYFHGVRMPAPVHIAAWQGIGAKGGL